jgi:hypothetical protein
MTYDELAREYGEACLRNLEKDAEIARLQEVVRLAYERNASLDEKLNQSGLDFSALREENALKDRQIDYYADQIAAQAQIIEQGKADNARLREAIKLEAHNHRVRNFYMGRAQVECPCGLCLIAREEEK